MPWKELKTKQAGDGGSSGPSFVNVAAQIIYPRVKQMSPGEVQAGLRVTAVLTRSLAPQTSTIYFLFLSVISELTQVRAKPSSEEAKTSGRKWKGAGRLLPAQPYCLLLTCLLVFKFQPSCFLLLLH